MGLLAVYSLTSTIGPPEPGKTTLNRWTLAIVIVGFIIVGALFSLIYFSTAQVSSKTFSYSPPPDADGTYGALSISDVNGLVTVVPWLRPNVLINGTVIARGLGSSLSTVNLSNSSSNGDVAFHAMFPANAGFFFSQSYSVNVNVFVPSSTRFTSVQVSNVNGGVRIENLNSTTVDLKTVNGAVSVGCMYCLNVTATSTNGNITAKFATLVDQGSYNLTATNANMAFTVSSSASFRLSASVLNGFIQVSGFPDIITTNQTSLNHTFGTDGASVNIKTVNGQITITGT
ncbi:MAG: hypothetical protein AUG17_03850 [Crenarchaeota archaeon 13_1_20CM_2_53_14]|nr:MAG: hypothetical protein AUI07_06465 [archaeon 13_2_20CM_2_53_6]OLE59186.1 MAG: hypothetical protein AUG17_03850 [Crenarchaeota archaeon 13_1_20CM_2_53_14]